MHVPLQISFTFFKILFLIKDFEVESQNIEGNHSCYIVYYLYWYIEYMPHLCEYLTPWYNVLSFSYITAMVITCWSKCLKHSCNCMWFCGEVDVHCCLQVAWFCSVQCLLKWTICSINFDLDGKGRYKKDGESVPTIKVNLLTTSVMVIPTVLSFYVHLCTHAHTSSNFILCLFI